jgi:hypothetical protein
MGITNVCSAWDLVLIHWWWWTKSSKTTFCLFVFTKFPFKEINGHRFTLKSSGKIVFFSLSFSFALQTTLSLSLSLSLLISLSLSLFLFLSLSLHVSFLWFKLCDPSLFCFFQCLTYIWWGKSNIVFSYNRLTTLLLFFSTPAASSHNKEALAEAAAWHTRGSKEQIFQYFIGPIRQTHGFGHCKIFPNRLEVVLATFQGCQTVYFQTKNPKLNKFGRVLQRKTLV